MIPRQQSQAVLITKKHITEYIPQKHPIVMVDELLYCDEKKTVSGFFIDLENIFVKNGFMTVPGIIENMAQTGALKAGYESKKMGIEPVVGFIGAIKDLIIHFLPKAGSEIQTEIVITHEVFNVTLVKTRTYCREALVAECEMKIAIQKTMVANH